MGEQLAFRTIMPAFGGRDRGAEFDDPAAPVHRFRLWRIWDWTQRPCLFVMLNPSRADADDDDPTIRACTTFAKGFGAGGIEVVNLFSYITPYPTALRAWLKAGLAHPGGDDGAARAAYEAAKVRNLAARQDAARRAGRIVAAWGADPVARAERPGCGVVADLATIADVWCLGRTQDGAPKHPGRLAHATPLSIYAAKTNT